MPPEIVDVVCNSSLSIPKTHQNARGVRRILPNPPPFSPPPSLTKSTSLPTSPSSEQIIQAVGSRRWHGLRQPKIPRKTACDGRLLRIGFGRSSPPAGSSSFHPAECRV